MRPAGGDPVFGAKNGPRARVFEESRPMSDYKVGRGTGFLGSFGLRWSRFSDVQQAVSFFNSTLGKFADTVRVLTESLPYGAHDRFNDSGKAADAIEAIIYSIDAEAMMPGAYWPDYAKEVGGLMYGLDEAMEWQRARFLSSPPDPAGNWRRSMNKISAFSD